MLNFLTLKNFICTSPFLSPVDRYIWNLHEKWHSALVIRASTRFFFEQLSICFSHFSSPAPPSLANWNSYVNFDPVLEPRNCFPWSLSSGDRQTRLAWVTLPPTYLNFSHRILGIKPTQNNPWLRIMLADITYKCQSGLQWLYIKWVFLINWWLSIKQYFRDPASLCPGGSPSSIHTFQGHHLCLQQHSRRGVSKSVRPRRFLWAKPVNCTLVLFIFHWLRPWCVGKVV